MVEVSYNPVLHPIRAGRAATFARKRGGGQYDVTYEQGVLGLSVEIPEGKRDEIFAWVEKGKGKMPTF